MGMRSRFCVSSSIAAALGILSGRSLPAARQRFAELLLTGTEGLDHRGWYGDSLRPGE